MRFWNKVYRIYFISYHPLSFINKNVFFSQVAKSRHYKLLFINYYYYSILQLVLHIGTRFLQNTDA